MFCNLSLTINCSFYHKFFFTYCSRSACLIKHTLLLNQRHKHLITRQTSARRLTAATTRNNASYMRSSPKEKLSSADSGMLRNGLSNPQAEVPSVPTGFKLLFRCGNAYQSIPFRKHCKKNPHRNKPNCDQVAYELFFT